MGVEGFNRIHSNDQSKDMEKIKTKSRRRRIEEKECWIYKGVYISKESTKQQQQPEIKKHAANILQTAPRNKLARNAVIRAKQDKANELI